MDSGKQAAKYKTAACQLKDAGNLQQPFANTLQKP